MERLALMLLAAVACAATVPSKTIITPKHESREIVMQFMRGGARLGCQVDNHYDDFMGVFMECPHGRLIVARPTGPTRTALPGQPLQANCFHELANQCDAFWKKVYDAGAAPCQANEAIAGCGDIRCSEVAGRTCADLFGP